MLMWTQWFQLFACIIEQLAVRREMLIQKVYMYVKEEREKRGERRCKPASSQNKFNFLQISTFFQF